MLFYNETLVSAFTVRDEGGARPLLSVCNCSSFDDISGDTDLITLLLQ